MKLSDIIDDEYCYVYSTSYTFNFLFPAAPFTTVAPLDRDFRKSVSFMWLSQDRRSLPQLHADVIQAVKQCGLARLYRLSVFAFAWRGQVPPLFSPTKLALMMLTELARQAGDQPPHHQFPFPERTMLCLRSFAPSKLPASEAVQEARAVWQVIYAGEHEARDVWANKARDIWTNIMLGIK